MRAVVIASLMLLAAGPVVAATASSSDKASAPDQTAKSGPKHESAASAKAGAKEGAKLNAEAKKADNLKGPVIPQGDRISN